MAKRKDSRLRRATSAWQAAVSALPERIQDKTSSGEFLTAEQSWDDDPIATFVLFRDYVLGGVRFALRVYQRAQHAHGSAGQPKKYPRLRDFCNPEEFADQRERWEMARSIWHYTPIAQFLTLPEPVTLDGKENRPAGRDRMTGACYHNLGHVLADACLARIEKDYPAEDYVRFLERRGATTDVVGRVMSWLPHIECECVSASERWRNEHLRRGSHAATGKPRGRKKADYKTIQRERNLAAEWNRAKENGVYKAHFAKDRGMTQKDFDKLLDRVAARNRRSEK